MGAMSGDASPFALGQPPADGSHVFDEHSVFRMGQAGSSYDNRFALMSVYRDE